MTKFVRRFMGVLVLDPVAFEDIERDRRAGLQSIAVVVIGCSAAGVAAINLGAGVAGFTASAVAALGAWLVWVTVVALIGTLTFPEPSTRSSTEELLRTLGFAAAPAVFLVFASLRTATPIVLIVVGAWMIAAEVVAMRQALDYESTGRAVAVSILGWVVAVLVIVGLSMLLTAPVS